QGSRQHLRVGGEQGPRRGDRERRGGILDLYDDLRLLRRRRHLRRLGVAVLQRVLHLLSLRERRAVHLRLSRRIAVALAVALALWWLWPRREPAWTLALAAGEEVVTPWQPATLAARIVPAPGREGWSWRWQADGGSFSGQGP